MASGNYVRILRQLLLFTLMITIAGGSYLSRLRSTSWKEPLWVTVYPILGDDSPATRKYTDRLTVRYFEEIERFMEAETTRYGVDIERPVRVDVGELVTGLPPPPPATNNPVRIAYWSLKLRMWARSATENQPGPAPNIRLFLVYHDPEKRTKVPHSLGLQEGYIGVVHVFADRRMQGRNNVVIAHEMLHTLGATDKYAMSNNLPLHPEGYANPGQNPLYPQKRAEIMGGRIPLSRSKAVMPDSLETVIAGTRTAAEIRWIN
jgi:hypothetical protein